VELVEDVERLQYGVAIDAVTVCIAPPRQTESRTSCPAGVSRTRRANCSMPATGCPL